MVVLEKLNKCTNIEIGRLMNSKIKSTTTTKLPKTKTLQKNQVEILKLKTKFKKLMK